MSDLRLNPFSVEFDWLAFLENQVACEQPVAEHIHRRLNRLAGSWVTCACGQACRNIPRDFRSIPEDYELRGLGADFPRLIRNSKWLAALQVLHAIERRTATVMATQSPNP